MPYRLRYHPEAKRELQKCKDTYKPTKLPGKLSRWIDELALEAESKKWALSADLEKLLENIDDAEEMVRRWPTVWQRFWTASFVDKLRAVLVAITQWRPPYEPRAAVRSFKIYSEECEVTTLYLVDHSKKEVVFMQFDGLPMQGYE